MNRRKLLFAILYLIEIEKYVYITQLSIKYLHRHYIKICLENIK